MAGPFDKYVEELVAPLGAAGPPSPPTPRSLVGLGLREMNKNFKPALAKLVAGASVPTPDVLLSAMRIKKALGIG